MECDRIEFSGHAIRRMFERHVTTADVGAVVAGGKVIIEYKDDKPFPSYVMLGEPNGRPLHVVIGVDNESRLGRVITVYVPDDFLWDDGYSVRKPQ
jgi:hypothetical protein